MHKVLPIINASTLEQAQHYAFIKERQEDAFSLHVKEIMRLYKMGTKAERAIAQTKTKDLNGKTRLIFKYKNQAKKEIKVRKHPVGSKLQKKSSNKINLEVTCYETFPSDNH